MDSYKSLPGPTRITDRSATLIDNVYASSMKDTVTCMMFSQQMSPIT